jgi:hypothetical protein
MNLKEYYKELLNEALLSEGASKAARAERAAVKAAASRIGDIGPPSRSPAAVQFLRDRAATQQRRVDTSVADRLNVFARSGLASDLAANPVQFPVIGGLAQTAADIAQSEGGKGAEAADLMTARASSVGRKGGSPELRARALAGKSLGRTIRQINKVYAAAQGELGPNFINVPGLRRPGWTKRIGK